MVHSVAISPRNIELLNKIIRELLASLERQMLEFVEILLDVLILPSSNKRNLVVSLAGGNKNLAFDEDEGMGYYDLGYNNIVGMIHLRNMILDFQKQNSSANISEVDYILQVLHQVDTIHNYFIHILKCLSLHVEVPICTSIYKTTLAVMLPYFEQMFFSMKTFYNIVCSLLDDARKTGLSDDDIFQVDSDVFVQIQQLKKLDHQFNGLIASLDTNN
ncbi:uncharacterized protein Ecym_2283 [Eremothecium cymbalariae DBVPG|uniref:Uncharacterized protein n=1 Tax=Eremothecium cymbalariae (strain CBS 270.75 / DBVPG 7215 / KCTC 17166 / NRRL Y-17582) TaxID=931890 RepID=G8JPS3_ERECY|nr:Hypothetical protein Ecym_2283 [Eremothecium cymbalariae DBVPG\